MRRALLVTTILAPFAVATPAYAQDSGVDESSGEIVVTARKRAENLIDVPLPVSVATAEQLQRDQINNVTDLQRLTPALEVSQSFGGETNGGGRLRGLGTGVFNPSVQSSVALVIDQAPVGNLNFPLLYDLAQVEVLRGPQGTLFGQGASAGVINITTRAPTFDAYHLSGSIDIADKGTAGSEVGELIFNGALNAPLSDKVGLRIATQFKRETGLQRSMTTGKDNRIDDFGIRTRLLLKPSDTVTLNLSAEFGRNTSNGQTFAAIAIAPNSTTPFGPPGGTLGGISNAAFLNPAGCAMTVISPRAEQYCEAIPTFLQLKMSAFSLVTDWEASDALTVTSVTSYRTRKFTQLSRDFSRLSTAAAARQERTFEASEGFMQELRANYDGEAVDVVLGGVYSDFKFNRDPIGGTFGSNLQGQRVGFSVCPASGIGFCPVPTSFTDELTKTRSLAAFADATFKVSDQFDVFGGLRFSDFKNDTTVQVFRATPGPVRTQPLSENNLSGRIGASYRPNSSTNIYASFARGYKPGAVGTAATGALITLDPELSDAFELGAKFGVGRFQLAANVFYTSIKDFQSQKSVFVGTALVSEPFNVGGSVKSKGFEVTAFGEVAPGLSINAGYQFNDVKYPSGIFGDDAVDRNADQVFDDNVITGLPFRLDGRQFLNAPKHKITLSGEYATEVTDALEVFANGNVIYKSGVLLANRANPAFVYPGHAIVNVGLGMRHPDNKWTASIFVRNLTKEREPMTYLANTFAGQVDGGIRAWPIAGLTARVVGVRLGFGF